jgi:formate dehydrogenase gamma subunit
VILALFIHQAALGGKAEAVGSSLAAPDKPPVLAPAPAVSAAGLEKPQTPAGVCPPFKLRDEQGQVIDPVHGVNDRVPYSPKQTCGACHNYQLITEGYHFTQGKGEALPQDFAARCNWVLYPGNYGGNWCFAPLLRQLAPKQNTKARMIDMTSFEFVTANCGACHPGGGPLEYDRDGFRYDAHMRDPAAGLTPGGDNQLDGDYFKARWSETGVIEADCLLCHMPKYDYKKRNNQFPDLNFKWAATVGAGFGTVSGKVAAGQQPEVTYNREFFDAEGNVKLHLAPEPRNENCLSCHTLPEWKKRGAAFSSRTDTHLKAGLRCVDCHAAGSKAADPRIRGKEVHQIGKGDDPATWVRNDLDNTVRQCADCHLTGYLNAPIAKHEGFPPVHLEKLSCQACHIPWRAVKSGQVQMSDVFNTGPFISPPPKRIWTYYDPFLKYWNFFGELDRFTVHDQPTDPYRPILVRYKGKIFPVNRAHSAWPGLIEEGKPGLNQVFMKDVFLMWQKHRQDPSLYPELAKIRDDNGDGVPEVNRPEEIDAFIKSVKAYLTDTGFDLAGKTVVWVMDDRAYTSGAAWQPLPKYDFEASPYASVYKYSHDVAPAKAALGAKGCTDCHSSGAPSFNAAIVKYPFGDDGQAVYIPQFQLLGSGRLGVWLSAWRESWLKPLSKWLFGFVLLLALLHYVTFGPRRVPVTLDDPQVQRYTPLQRLVHALLIFSFLALALTALMFWFSKIDAGGSAGRLHVWAGLVFGAALLATMILFMQDMRFISDDRRWLARWGGYFGDSGELPAGKFNAGQKVFFWCLVVSGLGQLLTGLILYLAPGLSGAWSQIVYTVHDALGVLLILLVLGHVYLAVFVNPGALRTVFEGRVLGAPRIGPGGP